MPRSYIAALVALANSRPYGVPHIDLAGWPSFVVVLPAADDEGFAADLWERLGLKSRVDIAREVDVIGLHEFGHALNIEYLYVLAPGVESLSVQWFDELMATYFGQGHLWHTQGFDVDPIQPGLISDTVPRCTSLLEGMQQQPLIAPGDVARLEQAVTSLRERVLRLEEHQQLLERLVEERPSVRSLAEPAGSDAAGERTAGTS